MISSDYYGDGSSNYENLYESQSSGKYGDFQTIDWLRDISKDRTRHRHLVKLKNKNIWQHLKFAHDSSSGWLCVLLVGCMAGLCAAIIDIGASWMSDLKEGVCIDAFWLNREQCCWSSNTTESCGQLWLYWSEMYGIASSSVIISYIMNYFMYIIWAFLLSGLTAMLVRMFAPYACGSGIPEIKTILSGFVIRGYLGKWTLIIKSICMMLAVSSGLCLGKEGPLVHVSTCCGNVIAHLFPKYSNNEAKRREVLSAAAAAGVSVAFGAPVGGVLFSLEEVSYYFPLKTLWRSFFCALAAAFVLRSFNPFGNDHLVMFYIEYHNQWFLIELLPFIILGLFGGIWGALFIKSNIKWCQLRRSSRFSNFPIAEVVMLATITAIISYPNPYTRMNSSQLIQKLVQNCKFQDDSDLCDYDLTASTVKESVHEFNTMPLGEGAKRAIWQLILALIFKMIFTIITYGIKVPAGLFIPNMAIGAIMGRLIGTLMEQIAYNNRDQPMFSEMCNSGHGCVTPGLYAMVGAAAVLGGTTRMTVSLVVIMFELTGGLQYIVPLMLAIMTSKWVADSLGKHGIYDAHIKLDAYPYLDTRDEFTHTTPVIEVLKHGQYYLPLSVLTQDTMTIDDIESELKASDLNGFPIVVSRESLLIVGFVSRIDLIQHLSAARSIDGVVGRSTVYFVDSTPASSLLRPKPFKLTSIVDMAPITVAHETPMETVIDMFRKLGLRQALITQNGQLLGVITKKDILRHIVIFKSKK